MIDNGIMEPWLHTQIYAMLIYILTTRPTSSETIRPISSFAHFSTMYTVSLSTQNPAQTQTDLIKSLHFYSRYKKVNNPNVLLQFTVYNNH